MVCWSNKQHGSQHWGKFQKPIRDTCMSGQLSYSCQAATLQKPRKCIYKMVIPHSCSSGFKIRLCEFLKKISLMHAKKEKLIHRLNHRWMLLFSADDKASTTKVRCRAHVHFHLRTVTVISQTLQWKVSSTVSNGLDKIAHIVPHITLLNL